MRLEVTLAMHPLETQPRVGDVFAPAQHRHPHGIDICQGRTDQMQNDFQIVNHEIEHDADLRAAIRDMAKDDALR